SPVAVGTATSSYARVFVSGVDKAGNEGARAETLIGKDVDPPVVDPTLIAVLPKPTGTNDLVRGKTGGLTDASAITTVSFYGAPCLGLALGSTTFVAPDGSFSAT